MPDELHLDHATHTYTVGDTVYPGVTDILKAAGLIDGEWFTEESRERGELVHIATALYDQSRLKLAQVPDEIRGYVEGWIKFRNESVCQIVEIETHLCSTVLGFAGTRDRLIKMHGISGILDIKTGTKVFWHAIQTGGYKALDHAARRFCIYLKSNGTYKIDPHNDDIDVHNFHTCLSMYKIKKRNGLV